MKNMINKYFQYSLTDNAKFVIIGIIILILFHAMFVPEFEKPMVLTQVLPGYAVNIPVWLRLFVDMTMFVILARTLYFIHDLYVSDGIDIMAKSSFVTWLIIIPIIYGGLASALNIKLELLYLYIIANILIMLYVIPFLKHEASNVYGFYLLIGAVAISTAMFHGGLAGITIFLIVSVIIWLSHKVFIKFTEVK